MVQTIRLQAAMLRFFKCQIRGGTLSAKAMTANVGRATEADVRLSGVDAIVNDVGI